MVVCSPSGPVESDWYLLLWLSILHQIQLSLVGIYYYDCLLFIRSSWVWLVFIIMIVCSPTGPVESDWYLLLRFSTLHQVQLSLIGIYYTHRKSSKFDKLCGSFVKLYSAIVVSYATFIDLSTSLIFQLFLLN